MRVKVHSKADVQNFNHLTQQLLSVEEAAALVDRNPSTIKMHIYLGNILAIKKGGERRGVYLVSRQSLLAFYPKKTLER